MASSVGLLPGELSVGKFNELPQVRGDNLTPHHIPSANRMMKENISRRDGISIMVEQPSPGQGGRHRKTKTYGSRHDEGMSPRDALADGIKDLKEIYKQDNLYGSEVRSALQRVIRENKNHYPAVFNK
ncbi:hypothetical protein GGQ91_005714 [Methylobacterium fujisawaense]|uniref:Tox-SHH domain-containing protein n=1 Tax=Methylobacterium fujisawaense TaxID=107400 RepID=A0ABR6DJL5_9HYPH|nr:hypothetical protein [Methylobacterium fujisawaense]